MNITSSNKLIDLGLLATFKTELYKRLVNATTATDGLMSKEDKTKLDSLVQGGGNPVIITDQTEYPDLF